MSSSQVTIREAGGSKSLDLELIGDDEIAGGDPVWTESERYGRNPMTTWEGTTAYRWTLPLSLDRFDERRSVERQVATLEAWKTPADKQDQPPALIVDAPLGRGRATSRWVITSLEWGEQIRNDAGARIRQDVRVNLLEYEPGQVKKGPAAKSRDNAKTHKWVPISAKDRRCKVCKRPRDSKVHSNR